MAETSKSKSLAIPTEDVYKEVTIELEPEKGTFEEQAKCSLVGKILSEKVLNRGTVKSIITKAWGNLDDLKISDLGPNIYLFVF